MRHALRPGFATVASCAFAAAVGAFCAAGCSTYHDELDRGQRAYEQNANERALATFRLLEPDLGHLDASERGRYFFLRGMADYRIGYRADARHWLSLAQATDAASPGAVPGPWKADLDQALAVLNAEVYAQGFSELVENRTPGGKEPAPAPSSPAADGGSPPTP